MGVFVWLLSIAQVAFLYRLLYFVIVNVSIMFCYRFNNCYTVEFRAFGIIVTGEPVSMMNLICRLLTNSVFV